MCCRCLDKNPPPNRTNKTGDEKREREIERASSQENKRTHLPGVHVRPHVVVVVVLVVLAKAELRCVRSHSFYVLLFFVKQKREKFKNSSPPSRTTVLREKTAEKFYFGRTF